jgi:hypothetical protein
VSKTIDQNILDYLEAAPVPYDFFREVHKGLRFTLFDVTAFVGAAACDDEIVRAEIADRVHALVALLHSHHGHEDGFIKPLLDTHAPDLGAIVDAGHEEIDHDLAEIELRVDRLCSGDDVDGIAAGLDLYRYLASFASKYLAHMEFEEGFVMGALRDAMSIGELFEVDMALRAAVPPPTMCAFIAVMLPAMNLEERTNMLGGMKAGAPPEIFELFRAAAEAALTPSDYGIVAARLGLA